MKQLFAPWRHPWVTGGAAQQDGGGIGGGECLFCRVWRASGDDEANLVVRRAADGLIMLNKYPYNGGHLLVVPAEHCRALEELSPAARASLMELAAESLRALTDVSRPEGYNVGINQGRAAGAGIPDHVHLHIVPRWAGDTNFMTAVGETRVISTDLSRTRGELAAWFDGLAPMSGRYWIETWGCQMNEHDSERLAGLLEGQGYEPADSPEDADVVLLNTCAIREKAEEKVYGRLARLRTGLGGRSDVLVGVCGCVAQLAGEGIRRRAPFVDLVLGPRALSRLPDHLREARRRGGIVDTTVCEEADECGRETAPRRTHRAKAYVTVMEGCNKSCAYCVVPATRGPEVSRTLRSVLDEVGALAAEGRMEIEFLGQNVNAWRCPDAGVGLADLLRAAGRVAGVRRIRVTTSHPLHLTDAIIAAIGEVDAVCNALHLPVQSGSSRVLRAMRRGYDRELYLRKVEQLRRGKADLALSTDFIVGFPGETEADFRETLSLLEVVRFDQVFSFVYSPRPGTAAAALADETPPERKAERLQELQAAQRDIQLEIGQTLLGRRLEALVESRSRKSAAEWAGRTTCNRVVNFAAPDLAPGDLAMVEITGAGPNSLRGRIARDPHARAASALST